MGGHRRYKSLPLLWLKLIHIGSFDLGSESEHIQRWVACFESYINCLPPLLLALVSTQAILCRSVITKPKEYLIRYYPLCHDVDIR